MGRKCAVPHCYTGYRKCADKASLYKVPDDDFFLSKWQEAIAREDRPITPKDYVCEKHFKDEDILRKRIRKDVVEEYQRPRLKPDAIPSIFPDLPEFILKMTKKRRKIDTDASNNIINISVECDPRMIEQEDDIKDEPEYDNDQDKDVDLNNEEIDIKTEIEDDIFAEETETDATGAKLYKCDECSYKTKFSHNLRTHKVKHLSGEDAYMHCELCTNYKTKWETTYLNHMKTKHSIILKEIFKCPFCPFRSKNRNFLARHCKNEHESSENVDKEFKCEFDHCNYETHSRELLNIHNLIHGPSQMKVTDTERVFHSNSKAAVSKHAKSAHSKETNDNKQISKETKAHQSIKKESSSVKCSRCPYKANSKLLLEKHLLQHQMVAQKFRKSLLCCTRCKYETYSESSLGEHLKDTFHCNECNYNSKDKSDYIKHTLTHRNTSVEVVVRKKEQNERAGVAQVINSGRDFSLVTIKEEDGLFIEDS